MIKQIKIYLPVILLISLLFSITISCKKDKKEAVPVLTTTEVTNITQVTAVCGGSIISEGDATITARGVCWSINTTPSITDNKTSDGAGAGSFTSNISGLKAKTTYFVRSYATNSFGTGYGDAMSFTTEVVQLPVVTTSPVSFIGITSAVSGGNITFWGYFPVTSRGVCWDTTTAPTIYNSKTIDGEGGGKFTSSITELLVNKTYFVRAYATNFNGTGYGDPISFKTSDPRDPYIGEWQFIESFKSTLGQSYIVNIIKDPDNSSQVILRNFCNPGSNNISAKGIVTSTQLVVSSQQMSNLWIVDGTGQFSNSNKTKMDWTFSITAGGSKDSYTATATKL